MTLGVVEGCSRAPYFGQFLDRESTPRPPLQFEFRDLFRGIDAQQIALHRPTKERVDVGQTANGLGRGARAHRGQCRSELVGGDTAVNELRALYADLPILLAAGDRDDELVSRFAEDRCIGLISKPYDPVMLQSALETLGLACRSSTKE